MRARSLGARIAVFYFLGFAAFGMYVPYFPEWLEARDVRGVWMGVVLAALPALGIIAPPVIGALADALHLRGKVLRVATLVAAISFIFVALSARLSGSVALIVLALAIVVFGAMRSPITLIADVLTLEALGVENTRYGLLRLWGSAGFLFGALVAGDVFDPRAPYQVPLAIAGTYALTFGASLLLPSRAAPMPALTWGAIKAAVPSVAFLFAVLLSQLGQSAYDVCFTLFARDVGVTGARIGILWAVGVSAEIALMWKSSALLSRYGDKPMLVVGLLGAAVRWGLLSRATGFFWILLLQPLHACSFACVWIAGIAIAARDSRHPATSQGVFSATLAVGAMAGMVAWGALYDARGGSAVYAAAAIASVGACLVALFVRQSAAASAGTIA